MYLRALLLWYLMRTAEGEFFGSDQFKTNVNVLEKGVHNLYHSATKICGFIHRKIISDYYKKLGLVPSENGNDINWSEVAKYFIGYITLSSICLVLSIVVPVTFLIICCCRTRGKCGRDNTPREKSRDRTVRIACSSILAVLTIGTFFCLFFAYTSNDILSETVSEPNGVLSKSIRNLKRMANYRDNIIKEMLDLRTKARSLAYKAKKELKDLAFEEIFNNSTDLSEISRQNELAINFTKSIQESFVKYQHDYHYVYNISEKLQEYLPNISLAEQLDNNACTRLIKSKNLANEIKNFNDNIFKTIENVMKKLSGKITDAYEYRNNLMNNFTVVFKSHKQLIQEADIGAEKIELIDEMISRLRDLPLNRTLVAISTKPMSDNIQHYEFFRFGLSLGLCLLINIILIIYAVALILPCLYGPKHPRKMHASAEVASSFLVLGTGLGIVAFSISLGMVVFLFLFGGITYTEVCRYAQPSISDIGRTPLGNVINAVVNERLLKGTPVYNISVTDVLSNCQSNVSIYEALNLESALHLRDYFNDGDRIDQIGSLYSDLGKAIKPLENHSIYPSKHQFEEFESSLKKFSKGKRYIKRMKDWTEGWHTCFKTLYKHNEIKTVRNLYKRDIKNMKSIVSNLNNVQYKKILRESRNVSDLISSVSDLFQARIEEIKTFQDRMAVDGIYKIHNMAKLIIPLQSLKHLIFHDMGRCGHLYSSLEELFTFGCTDILQALNAFWVAMGIAVMLLLLSFSATTSLVVLNRRKGKSSQCYKELNNVSDSPRKSAANKLQWRNEKKSLKTVKTDLLLLTPPTGDESPDLSRR
ncbi:unnamed protein product [Dimorphilus gyrociliatus]|uniref:Uncharacterized protein n=1 Tax=Dimorphilus gyrociliatus TaxID=2664684 RepID=A0A7I8W5L5_9ANNE|nr:unnamed protein product [Dimorphilus gyrociliatus]